MTVDHGRFLHYEIERRLGKGGMGEVFLAQDTRLKRPVALKFLSETVSEDLSAMERFEREAQAAASLTHPSIVTIYDIGEHQGRHYIAMEYVEGLSLRQMIAAGALPVEQTLAIARALTEGLEKAHEHGIVHRDIKPENILVTDDGQAKLLDFGIAKLKGVPNITRESMTVGTVRYMAPEQIKGEGVDQQADVWALGVVIYEMLTAHSPFNGDYDSTLMYSILSEPPEPMATYRSDIPAQLEALIGRALEKEPSGRYAGMGALRAAIDALRTPPAAATVPAAARKRARGWLRWAAVAGLLLGGWMLTRWFGPAPDQPPTAVMLNQVTYLGDVSGYDLAPDGMTAAYVASGRGATSALHVIDLGGGSSVEVLSARQLGWPAWSPNGTTIAVAAVLDDTTSGTFLVPRLGGSARRISHAVSLRIAWSPAGDRLALYEPGRVLLVRAVSGETTTVTLPDSLPLLRSLEWSPDGRQVLASSIGDQFSSLWLIDLVTGEPRMLYREPFLQGTVLVSPRWTPTDGVLYCLRRSIQSGEAEIVALQQTLPGRTNGSPRVIVFGLQDVTEFDLSADGRRILALREITHANLWLATERDGTLTSVRLTRGTAWRSRASLSPDGSQIAFSMKDVEGFNVYVMPIETSEGIPRAGQAAKITSLRTFTFGPVWSPDGREIAFGSAEGGFLQIWRISPDGSNLRRVDGARLHPGPHPLQWGPGREIVYASAEGNRLRRVAPESGRTEPLVLSDTSSSMDAPVWSPDGEHFAVRVHRGYEDSLTGVWIASRERLETQLHRGWEFVPLAWAQDGRRVFLIRSGRPDLYAVGFRGGTPRVVATLPFEAPHWTELSVHGSGKRVLYTRFSDRRDLWLGEPHEASR